MEQEKPYITASRLEQYITCPYKYYLANVRKLRKPFLEKAPQLAFDQALHKALGSFYKFHNKKEPFSFSNLLKALEYNWHPSGYENEQQSNMMKEVAIDCLKKYFESHCKEADSHIETDFFFKTEILGMDYGGKIDLINQNSDGTLEFVDYKSGKLPEGGVTELEQALSTQMLFLVSERQWSKKVKQLKYIYLKENITLCIEAKERNIESAKERFSQIKATLLEGKFPPTPSGNCNWCDYRAQCPEGQILILSVAKLKTYLDCPRKYSFKYVEKVSLPESPSSSPALLFYNYITNMLASLYLEKKQYRVEKLLEHAQKAISKNNHIEPEIKESILEQCQKTFEYINDIINKKGFPKSESIKNVLKHKEQNYILTAMLDRLDILENGNFQPIVYKTGKAFLSEKELKHDISSSFYWYLANKAYPDKIENIQFVYLLSGQSISFVPEKTAIKALEAAIDSLNNDKTFDCKQGPLCSWCSYYSHCPAWKIKPHMTAKESLEEYRQRLRLSYSKMSQYVNCPRAYKKSYVEGIKSSPQPYFDFGKAIHETFENFYSPKLENLFTPSLEKLIETYESVRLNHRSGMYNSEIEEHYRQDGLRQLTLYYNRFVKDKDFKPAYLIEQYFEIPCGKYAVMTGFIDRIDRLPDGSYEILDYKTEPTLRSQDDVDQDEQLSIYFMAATQCLGLDVSKLSLLMLDHDIKIETVRKADEIPSLIEKIDKIAYKMLNEKDFLPKKNKYCKSCDHLKDCPLREEILQDDSLVSMQKFNEPSDELEPLE